MNGAAANRPGMGWPQQAERMLGMEGINLGFGGQGKMQPGYIVPSRHGASTSGTWDAPATNLLSEVQASVVVIDCEFNMAGMDPLLVYNRTIDFVRSLRPPPRARSVAQLPPVLLLEGHDHGQAWISPSASLHQNATREAYRRAYNYLLGEGYGSGVFYGQGAPKLRSTPGGTLAHDVEAQSSTCAGVHPTPLGLQHVARYVAGLVTDVLRGTARALPQPTAGTWPPTLSPLAATPTPIATAKPRLEE